jgi:hypothetical protein
MNRLGKTSLVQEKGLSLPNGAKSFATVSIGSQTLYVT